MRLSPQLLFCSFLLMVLMLGTADAQCSGERWAVKVGTDNDAAAVNLYATTPTTIANLTSLTKPGSLPDTSRIQPTETTTWVITATLIKYARSFDSDYHMVFKDAAGRTMIGEIPDPGCVNGSSPFRSAIAHARAQFDAMFSATSQFQTTNTPVQITGVGFFDYFEGQEGCAANGIELHPIIDIDFGAAFSLASSPQSATVVQGDTASHTITSSIVNNFDSNVTLSASGLPSGASAAFSPSTIAAPGAGSSALTISVGPSTPVGTYNVILTGTGGGQSHTALVVLTVTSGSGGNSELIGNAGFENGSGNQLPWSASSGVIDGSSVMAPHTGSWKAWLDGFGTTHTDTLYQQVSIPANATSASLSFWKHIETVENKGKANDTVKVQIRNSSGTVLTTLATYSNLNSAAGYAQNTFDLLAYKGQTIQVYLIGIENSSLKTSFVFDDFSLSVTTPGSPSPNFALAASPSSPSIPTGGSGTSTITTSVSGGFNSSVSLSSTGLPTGTAASFSPASIAAPGSGTSTLTITVGPSTAAGTYNLTINGNGGGLTRSTPLQLSVTAVSGGTTTQILSNEGFENGSANPSPWVVTSGVLDNSSYQLAHAGSWKAWMNGYGTTHTDTLYQQAVIPSAATAVTLTFWRHIDTTETTTTTAYDTLKVQIRNSSGTVLATLATYSNLNAAAGYSQASFDLTAYKGQTIQVYLVGVEDASLKTSFVFDDFALNVTTP